MRGHRIEGTGNDNEVIPHESGKTILTRMISN
jgi:hypothetical protein